MSYHYRRQGIYPDYNDEFTDDYSWGDNDYASRLRESFDSDFADEFDLDSDFSGIASSNDCTGLIPNGMVTNYEGGSYADLYENVHQPKGDTKTPHKDFYVPKDMENKNAKP